MGNHITAHVKLEHDVYFPGNVVRGEATIKLDHDTECIAGRISCRGIERAVTLQQAADYYYPVSQDTVFYKETLTLFGHKVGDKDATPVKVSKGTFTYPFAFQLPMTLPSSLHHTSWSHGGLEIKYTVVAYLKFGHGKVDEGHHEFTVVAPLNRRDQLQSPPLQQARGLELHRLFGHKGHCDFRASVTHSLYAAGDMVEGEVSVNNTDGDCTVEWVKATVHLNSEGTIVPTDDQLHNTTVANASPPIARITIPVHAAPGKVVKAPFVIKLPQSIPQPSYPAQAVHVKTVHQICFDVDGGVGKHHVVLPVHIAATADPRNRFAFVQNDVPCGRNPAQAETEHPYAAPEGFNATPCPGLAPPEGLTPQAPPQPQTPQAVGDGHITV